MAVDVITFYFSCYYHWCVCVYPTASHYNSYHYCVL